jgi:hypothetical protein
MSEPRKGGSYVRDPKTGEVKTVWQPEQPEAAAERLKAEAAERRAKRLADRPLFPAAPTEVPPKPTGKKGATDVA